MSIRLIVTDIDGTILRSDGTLAQRTTEVFERAAAQGIQTVLASSRTPEIAREILHRVGHLTYMIMLTGCKVVNMETDEVLYHQAISQNAAMELAKFLDDADDAYAEICTDNLFVVSEKSMAYARRMNLFHRYLQDLSPALFVVESTQSYLQAHQSTVEKCFVYSKDRLRFQDLYDGIPHRGELKLVRPVAKGVDILPAGADKGMALRFLLKHLGLEEREVMVFGDSENDADMFLPGSLNVAVGNAFDSLKAKADFVSKTNDAQGVAYAIERFAL